MRIIVTKLSGDTQVEVDMQPDDVILSLKKHLQSIGGPAISQQCLLHGFKMLLDLNTFAGYGIVDGDTLNVVARRSALILSGAENEELNGHYDLCKTQCVDGQDTDHPVYIKVEGAERIRIHYDCEDKAWWIRGSEGIYWISRENSPKCPVTGWICRDECIGQFFDTTWFSQCAVGSAPKAEVLDIH